MTSVIDARNVRKTYGDTIALGGIDVSVEAGRIVGVIGPNGAGKTTLLDAILGLTSVEGEMRVLGLNPWRERSHLMRDVAFITDVAVLPRWIRVSQLLEYVEAMHPRFDRARATAFLARTSIRPEHKVKALSKGMVAQLHLAIVMAIDARLLVMDEPTLGLDILYRKQFYDSLLEDYYEKDRTILLATHDIGEIEHVVTDVIFLDRGRIVLSASMDEVESRFREVKVHPSSLLDAQQLSPISEREALGQHVMIFDGIPLETLAALGDVRTPSVADLFVAQLSAGDRR